MRHYPEQALIPCAEHLVKTTTYKRMAPLEEAPLYTDCLTSIHYIFRKAWGLDLSLTFIGDMPRALSTSSEWKLLEVDLDELIPGDLLFVKNISRPKLVAHVALALGRRHFFHCSRQQGGALIEDFESLSLQFEQKLQADMIRYIDPRNKKLREEWGGALMEKT